MTLLISVLSRSKISEIVPIARSIVIDSMSDGVLVLDDNNNILDLNRFMKKLMNVLSIKVNGKPLKKFMPELNSLIEKSNTCNQSGISYKIKTKIFDINISNFTNSRSTKIGKSSSVKRYYKKKKERRQNKIFIIS